jgi:Uma2 family endonuclease
MLREASMLTQTRRKSSRRGEPVWQIAQLYPDQGDWRESEYLALTTNNLVEFKDGFVEFLPMPDMPHQFIAHYLYDLLRAFVVERGLGRVFMAPTRARIRPANVREPDVFYIANEHIVRIDKDCCNKVDLVMEVVRSATPDDRTRDLVDKRHDYAEAGIAEYWIIDPRDRKITVLRLEGGRYIEHSEAGEDGTARSALLDGLAVDARQVWAAARPAEESR